MKQTFILAILLFTIHAKAQVLKEFLIEPLSKDASTYNKSCESPSNGVLVFKSAIKDLNISLYPPSNLLNMNYNEQNNEYVVCVKATTKRFRIDIRHAEYEYTYFFEEEALASDAKIYRVNPMQNDGVTKRNIGISQSNATPTLSVLPASLSFASMGEQSAFEISSNRNWTISNVPLWLTVEPLSGSNNAAVTITAAANTGSLTRTATLAVKAPSVRPQNINITQSTPILDEIYDNMVLVEGGTFTMGCKSDWFCNGEAVPEHRVTLSDYYMSIYEVTQAQWKAVMGANNNPSAFKGDRLPVESVSWFDAQDFIRKLNTLTGKQYRLPTEAEWEWAARGGVEGAKGQAHKYSGSDRWEDVAWSDSRTFIVGNKAPNELGIYDMTGSVWEWCSDWYGRYSSNPQTNPKGPSSGNTRVARGGDNSYAIGVIDRNHNNFEPYFRSNQYTPKVGFRLVCDPE